jgi:hypothetical protein
MFSNSFSKIMPFEIMWKKIVEPDRPQITIWRMRIACWIPKVTNSLSKYVILIACPQQQWLHERPPVLRYTYIACLVETYPCSAVCVTEYVLFINVVILVRCSGSERRSKF